VTSSLIPSPPHLFWSPLTSLCPSLLLSWQMTHCHPTASQKWLRLKVWVSVWVLFPLSHRAEPPVWKAAWREHSRSDINCDSALWQMRIYSRLNIK
jgi:hypothetical protein